MSIRSLLFRSPEWNFAREIAAHPYNSSIQLDANLVDLGPNKCFFPANAFKNHDLVSSHAQKLEPFQRQIIPSGLICEHRYRITSNVSPFHLINRCLVAFVKTVPSSPKNGLNAALSDLAAFNLEEQYMLALFGQRQLTDAEILKAVDADFSQRIITDISNWNKMMHQKLLLIFTNCISMSALFVLSQMLMLKVACVAFFCFALLAALRLYQFYSLQYENQKITNLGHWVIALWKARTQDPSLAENGVLKALFAPRSLSFEPLEEPRVIPMSPEGLLEHREFIASERIKKFPFLAAQRPPVQLNNGDRDDD